MRKINGEILIAILKKLSGMSDHDLGTELGVDHKTVGRWVKKASGKDQSPTRTWTSNWKQDVMAEIFHTCLEKQYKDNHAAIIYECLEVLDGLSIDSEAILSGYENSNMGGKMDAVEFFRFLVLQAKNFYDQDSQYLKNAENTHERFSRSTSADIWCPLKRHAQAILNESSFYGRKELIDEISTRLHNHKNSPVILWGMGGIGKTALACHYAVYEAKSHQVFITQYHNSFRETIANLELRKPNGKPIVSGDVPIDQRYYSHLHELRKLSSNIILIVDNVDTADDFTLQNEFSELSSLDMQFIITTRNDMRGDGRALYIGELPPADRDNLARNLYSSVEKYVDTLQTIYDTVQNNTLAIELILKSLESSGGRLSPSDVLITLQNVSEFDEDKWEPVRREYGPDKEEVQAIKHLSAVFNASSLSSDEQHILGSFALANGVFRTEELKNYWSKEEIRLIRGLQLKGWLNRSSGLLTLHPLIRCVILVNHDKYLSWEGNGRFILSVIIHANIPLMYKNMKSIGGYHGYPVAANMLKYMHDSIPRAYVSFLYSFIMYCYWSTNEVTSETEIDRLYDLALSSCESNSIVKYLIFDSYNRILSKQMSMGKLVSEKKNSIWESLFCMMWNVREYYFIPNEILDVLKQRISFLLCNSVAPDEFSFETTYTYERLTYELYILGWLVNDKELELKSAVAWADNIHNGQDYLLWAPIIANAEMHMGAKDAEYFDKALATIQMALNCPGRLKRDEYRIARDVAKIAISICEAACKQEEKAEWVRKLVEADNWLLRNSW